MGQAAELTLRPIGRVKAVEGGPGGKRQAKGEGEALIVIDEAWADALEGIEEFSHVWVLWWFDQSTPPDSPRVHPEGRPEMPLVGLFATRSPRRPNPLALTAVGLEGRQGNRLRVQGLDARDGTPVLDIKPYLRRGDRIPEATMPAWLERLWRIHDEERGG